MPKNNDKKYPTPTELRTPYIPYYMWTWDLSTARDNEKFLIPIHCDTIACPEVTGVATIRLNSHRNPALIVGLSRKIDVRPSKITEIYISNAAQPGKYFTLTFGGEHSFEVSAPTSMTLLDTKGAGVDPASEFLSDYIGYITLDCSAVIGWTTIYPPTLGAGDDYIGHEVGVLGALGAGTFEVRINGKGAITGAQMVGSTFERLRFTQLEYRVTVAGGPGASTDLFIAWRE